MRPFLHASTIILSSVLVLTACSSGPAPEEPSTATPGTAGAEGSALGDPKVVAEGLNAPWSIAFADDTPVVSERDSARIIELDEQGEPREIAVIDEAAPSGEGGLLGIAIYEEHLYAYLTTATDNRIHRYELTGDPGALELGQPDVVLDDIPAAEIHNGGRIAFGPDDMLYVTTGDASDTSNAQNVDSLAGKILRLTPDGEIPDDNPLGDSPVYSYGHRNPQGIAWSADGTMYASEFGQDTWDELNVIEPGGNYGWPEVEGIAEDEDFIDPIQQWQPAQASPSAIEIIDESLFIANLRGQRLWEVPLDEPGASAEHYTDEFGRLREVTTGPDGALWIVTNNTDGRGQPSETDDRILRVELS